MGLRGSAGEECCQQQDEQAGDEGTRSHQSHPQRRKGRHKYRVLCLWHLAATTRHFGLLAQGVIFATIDSAAMTLPSWVSSSFILRQRTCDAF
jgi:hypothetical protein